MFQQLEDGRWALQEFDQPDQVLEIAPLHLKISVEQVYNKVKWETDTHSNPQNI